MHEITRDHFMIITIWFNISIVRFYRMLPRRFFLMPENPQQHIAIRRTGEAVNSRKKGTRSVRASYRAIDQTLISGSRFNEVERIVARKLYDFLAICLLGLEARRQLVRRLAYSSARRHLTTASSERQRVTYTRNKCYLKRKIHFKYWQPLYRIFLHAVQK